MMSLLAPSCAPASRIWATSSSSSETVSSSHSPLATAVTPSRKSWPCRAIRSAIGRQSSELSPRAGAALDIEQPPSSERPAAGDLVGVLKLAAHGQAAGRPGHPQPYRLDEPGQVCGGRLTLEVGVGRQDQLGDRAVGQPLHQLRDPQVIGPDSVDRAYRAAEDMVTAPELADLLNRRDVLGLLDDADHREIAPRVPADAALVLLGDVAADAAELHPLQHLDQRGGQAAYVGRISGQQVEGDALGALRPDARQLTELVDEVLNDAFVHLRTSRPPRHPPSLVIRRPAEAGQPGESRQPPLSHAADTLGERPHFLLLQVADG